MRVNMRNMSDNQAGTITSIKVAGDLGRRLTAAFQEAFREGTHVVVVGTDAPGVRRSVVEDAFQRLEQGDLVLGPATDGGYYLLGLSRPAPELFQDIPWSTDGVLEATRSKGRALGLREETLGILPDIDTLEDLRSRWD